MEYVFLLCAIVGGTVFLFQFVLALVGFGAEQLDIPDLPEDVDLPDDVDLSDHGSTWLFGVISFRTVVAALTFFGLAGLASLYGGFSEALATLVAVGSGGLAMAAVHWLMQKLYNLRQDGSIRIERSVGKPGTIYIPVPPNRSGTGKVQLRLQGRIVEYPAMTSEAEKLPTGAKVIVVDIIGPSTLIVEAIRETIASSETAV